PLPCNPWPHFHRRTPRMSGLQEFLTPFSHLIFANRDKVIVLLAALLGWFTIQLLITRWRNERLERDLSAAKTGGSAPGGRRDGLALRHSERSLGRADAAAPSALGLSGRGRPANAGGAAWPGPLLSAATGAIPPNGSAPVAIADARRVRTAPSVRTTGLPSG